MPVSDGEKARRLATYEALIPLPVLGRDRDFTSLLPLRRQSFGITQGWMGQLSFGHSIDCLPCHPGDNHYEQCADGLLGALGQWVE